MIELGPALHTGYTEIDNQHQRLFDLFNQLKTPASERAELLPTSQVLQQISEYIDAHFSFEEQWMREVGYPDYDAHQREHAAFVEQNLQFLREYHFGGSLTEEDIARYLERWLVQHISGTDMKVVQYLQSSD
ncbi:hypothetical protein DV711_02310 [Motiliproteus coralliicola]|uniref:Hemerythrin-like domain-containing protein n=1 Tax=Motiliproteus coralliicola TaxID=2283196 RepID=A0A369WSB2_9GAMM|nr:bacteriohemerythrin [Motiliproteus coralliicola]RDE24441.1 hypothetical protein DV711_02310 [Motiliproteus coralliicola]